MNAREHARLCRALVAACGGLEESAKACRLKRSRLSECQDPKAGAFLPADAMFDLEAYCGDPLYSRAMAEARPGGRVAGDLADEACRLTEIAVATQGLLRRVAAGQLGESARRQAVADLDLLVDSARALQLALDAGDES